MRVSSKILCILLLISVLLNLFQYGKNDTEIKIVTDTIWSEPDTVLRIDTVSVTQTVDNVVTMRVVDTVYVNSLGGGIVSLPRESKLYHQPNLYDIWISGVAPLSLDSAKIYQKTEIITKTERIREVIEENRTHYYVKGSLNRFRGTFGGSLGICITGKNKWLYGAEIGSLDGSMNYVLNIGYKLK